MGRAGVVCTGVGVLCGWCCLYPVWVCCGVVCGVVCTNVGVLRGVVWYSHVNRKRFTTLSTNSDTVAAQTLLESALNNNKVHNTTSQT